VNIKEETELNSFLDSPGKQWKALAPQANIRPLQQLNLSCRSTPYEGSKHPSLNSDSQTDKLPLILGQERRGKERTSTMSNPSSVRGKVLLYAAGFTGLMSYSSDAETL